MHPLLDFSGCACTRRTHARDAPVETNLLMNRNNIRNINEYKYSTTLHVTESIHFSKLSLKGNTLLQDTKRGGIDLWVKIFLVRDAWEIILFIAV